jgi:proline-specific peptidase
MVEAFVKVNGINICYEIFGEGTPLILIHGFGSSKKAWKLAQVGPLSRYFKVIILDNRGAGKSDRPDEPYLMEIFAQDIKELMDHLSIEKAHILGGSLGGMIAQRFTLNFPERVNKLILINTTPSLPKNPSGIEMYKNSKIAKYHAILEDPVKAFWDYGIGGYSRNFRKMLKENPKAKIHNMFTVEDLIRENAYNPSTPQDSINQTNAVFHFNVTDQLHEIKNETLIITATHDKTLPRSMSEIIHEKIPNSKFVLIEKAGHGSPYEKAPEINDHIIKFLGK